MTDTLAQALTRYPTARALGAALVPPVAPGPIRVWRVRGVIPRRYRTQIARIAQGEPEAAPAPVEVAAPVPAPEPVPVPAPEPDDDDDDDDDDDRPLAERHPLLRVPAFERVRRHPFEPERYKAPSEVRAWLRAEGLDRGITAGRGVVLLAVFAGSGLHMRLRALDPAPLTVLGRVEVDGVDSRQRVIACAGSLPIGPVEGFGGEVVAVSQVAIDATDTPHGKLHRIARVLAALAAAGEVADAG